MSGVLRIRAGGAAEGWAERDGPSRVLGRLLDADGEGRSEVDIVGAKVTAGRDSVTFRDDETTRGTVVDRRYDGHHGLLTPG
jgi:hypothetical protein